MEEVAYIGGRYKPLNKNKINDIILNGESLIKNKVVDLTNVIGSGGNVDLSDYVTKTDLSEYLPLTIPTGGKTITLKDGSGISIARDGKISTSAITNSGYTQLASSTFNCGKVYTKHDMNGLSSRYSYYSDANRSKLKASVNCAMYDNSANDFSIEQTLFAYDNEDNTSRTSMKTAVICNPTSDESSLVRSGQRVKENILKTDVREVINNNGNDTYYRLRTYNDDNTKRYSSIIGVSSDGVTAAFTDTYSAIGVYNETIDTYEKVTASHFGGVVAAKDDSIQILLINQVDNIKQEGSINISAGDTYGIKVFGKTTKDILGCNFNFLHLGDNDDTTTYTNVAPLVRDTTDTTKWYVPNKYIDLSGINLSNYVTKTGEDTITVNTSESASSGLIVQYGTDADTITNTTNITPLGIVTSYKSGNTNYNASYSINGMAVSTGTNTAIFGASNLQYAVGDKSGAINYADILTSADLSNYAKLDADNTFTGNNTFKSNVISQELDINTITDYNIGYVCSTTDGDDTIRAIFNPIQSMMKYTNSDISHFISLVCSTSSNGATGITVSNDNTHFATINTDLLYIRFGEERVLGFMNNDDDNKPYLILQDSYDDYIKLKSDGIYFNDYERINYSDIATKVTTTSSSDTAIILKPNANVDITPTAATVITIAKPTDTTIVNIYSCTINTKTSSGVTIALADTTATITWDDTPSFEANKLYEISVRYTPSGYFGLIHSWSL